MFKMISAVYSQLSKMAELNVDEPLLKYSGMKPEGLEPYIT